MSYSITGLLQHKRSSQVLIWGMVVIGLVYVVQVISQWHLPVLDDISSQHATHITAVPNIEQYHIFGTYIAGLDNLPDTNLALTLQGVVQTPGKPQVGVALIASPNTPAKLYHIGDVIPGGAVLKKVMSSQIIIQNQGQLQRLRLPIKTLF